MKFIKNHLMFIFPLMAILFGIEFYLAFERATVGYEKGLKDKYSMLVVSSKPMKLEQFKKLNSHISSLSIIPREVVVSKFTEGISKDSSSEIMSKLPYFYDLSFDSYYHLNVLKDIKKDLLKDKNITRVETFGASYASNYKLFTFIKFIVNIFILFMGITSLFLIIKQMEIWKYAHKDRMQIMEIFGAPLMLRSGILFKMAFFDAIVASLFVSGIFYFIKFYWAKQSGIDILIQNYDTLFVVSDIGILLGSSFVIVMLSVYFVVFSSKEISE